MPAQKKRKRSLGSHTTPDLAAGGPSHKRLRAAAASSPSAAPAAQANGEVASRLGACTEGDKEGSKDGSESGRRTAERPGQKPMGACGSPAERAGLDTEDKHIGHQTTERKRRKQAWLEAAAKSASQWTQGHSVTPGREVGRTAILDSPLAPQKEASREQPSKADAPEQSTLMGKEIKASEPTGPAPRTAPETAEPRRYSTGEQHAPTSTPGTQQGSRSKPAAARSEAEAVPAQEAANNTADRAPHPDAKQQGDDEEDAGKHLQDVGPGQKRKKKRRKRGRASVFGSELEQFSEQATADDRAWDTAGTLDKRPGGPSHLGTPRSGRAADAGGCGSQATRSSQQLATGITPAGAHTSGFQRRSDFRSSQRVTSKQRQPSQRAQAAEAVATQLAEVGEAAGAAPTQPQSLAGKERSQRRQGAVEADSSGKDSSSSDEEDRMFAKNAAAVYATQRRRIEATEESSSNDDEEELQMAQKPPSSMPAKDRPTAKPEPKSEPKPELNPGGSALAPTLVWGSKREHFESSSESESSDEDDSSDSEPGAPSAAGPAALRAPLKQLAPAVKAQPKADSNSDEESDDEGSSDGEEDSDEDEKWDNIDTDDGKLPRTNRQSTHQNGPEPRMCAPPLISSRVFINLRSF